MYNCRVFQDRSGRTMSILSWRTTTSRTSIRWSRTRVKCARYPWVHAARSPWPLTHVVSIWFALKTLTAMETEYSIIFAGKHSTKNSTKSYTKQHKVCLHETLLICASIFSVLCNSWHTKSQLCYSVSNFPTYVGLQSYQNLKMLHF